MILFALFLLCPGRGVATKIHARDHKDMTMSLPRSCHASRLPHIGHNLLGCAAKRRDAVRQYREFRSSV
jgi:hypothetical protein